MRLPLRKLARKIDWLDMAAIIILAAIIAGAMQIELQAPFVTFLICWVYWMILGGLAYAAGIFGK